MSEHAGDLHEAAAAAMRQLLEEAKALPALARVARRDYTDARTAAESRQAVSAIEALLARIDEALAGDAGRTFLAHLRRLEAENAELRQDGPRLAVENARIRGLLAHFEHCPHGCQDTPYCPHYKRVRELGLLPPLESSAKS